MKPRRARGQVRRLGGPQIVAALADCPDELCDLVLELRERVGDVIAEATDEGAARAGEYGSGVEEDVKFGCLCYFKRNHPYKSIGGNVCMIHWREDHVRLEFIHGASLPDPAGLLRGTAKSKRFVELRSSADLRRAAIADLIRAALAYSPLPAGEGRGPGKMSENVG